MQENSSKDIKQQTTIIQKYIKYINNHYDGLGHYIKLFFSCIIIGIPLLLFIISYFTQSLEFISVQHYIHRYTTYNTNPNILLTLYFIAPFILLIFNNAKDTLERIEKKAIKSFGKEGSLELEIYYQKLFLSSSLLNDDKIDLHKNTVITIEKLYKSIRRSEHRSKQFVMLIAFLILCGTPLSLLEHFSSAYELSCLFLTLIYSLTFLLILKQTRKIDCLYRTLEFIDAIDCLIEKNEANFEENKLARMMPETWK